jgi:hypothetical protein
MAIRELKGLSPSFDVLPITEHPENILLIVVGGPGRKSGFIPGWGTSLPVAWPIDLEDPLSGKPKSVTFKDHF